MRVSHPFVVLDLSRIEAPLPSALLQWTSINIYLYGVYRLSEDLRRNSCRGEATGVVATGVRTTDPSQSSTSLPCGSCEYGSLVSDGVSSEDQEV